MKFIDGSITAAQGFLASGVHVGIRKNKGKKDLALIYCETLCDAAAVYTTNAVKGAPLKVTKKHLENGKARAIVCNSGNANTCAANGEKLAEDCCAIVAKCTGVDASDVIVASTGVIGQTLCLEPFENGIPLAAKKLSKEGNSDAAAAIMTTDTVMKQFAVEFEIGGKVCRLGGIAKGSGMIAPNMATLLVFVTTDVNITSEMLQKAVSEDVKTSFNMVCIDGDTSTNDMLTVMASGLAGNERITAEGKDFDEFKKALKAVTTSLCKLIATDGEGASKLIECTVDGAKDYENARKMCKAIISSNLFKAAIFGADANWGRVLCAAGYSGADADFEKAKVEFKSQAGEIVVCLDGAGLEFDEDLAKKILTEKEIKVILTLKDGDGKCEGWGCDLTYDYVKINGDYRT